jgi:hypothetical protein
MCGSGDARIAASTSTPGPTSKAETEARRWRAMKRKLRRALGEKFVKWSAEKNYMVAIKQQFANEHPLGKGEVVSSIPTGGTTEKPIVIEVLHAAPQPPKCRCVQNDAATCEQSDMFLTR